MEDGQGRTLLASGGEDIKLWDLSRSAPVQQFSTHSDNVSNLAWSFNNQFIASSSASGDKVALNYINGSSVIDLAAGDNQTCLTLNSSSRYLACSGTNKIITVWDLKTKKLRKQYKGHKGTVTCITFNGNDSHIASGSSCGEVIIHRVTSDQSGSPLTNPTGQPIRNIQYSHFKKSHLAAVSDDGGLYLWDTNSGKLLMSFSNSHKAPATGLAFSPQNKLLLASCGLDKKIICYDVMRKQVIKSMEVDSPLTSLVFLHDGFTMAAGSSRGKIFIFDLRKGDVPLTTLVGHKSSIRCLCFQHDTSTAKVNGTSSKSIATPVQPTMANGAAKKSSRANQPSQQPLSRPPQPVKEIPAITTTCIPEPERPQNVPKEDPVPMRNSFDRGVISPLNDDKREEESSSHQSSSGRLETLGTDANGYGNNSSLTAGGIFSPLSGVSPGTDLRKAPIGSTGYGSSPYTATQPIRSDLLHRRSNTSPSINLNNNTPPLSVISTPFDNAANIPTTSATTDHSKITHGGRSSQREKAEQESTETNHILPGAIHRKGLSPQSTSSEELPISAHKGAPPRTASPSERSQKQPQLPTASSRPAEHSIDPVQVDFMRNMIEDAMEEFKDDVHRDMVNLHVEVVRQFQIQQNEMRALLQAYSVNEGLLAEIERLKEENKRLKATF